MPASHPMFIGGQLFPGKRTFRVCSPCDGSPFAEIAWADADDAEAALSAAAGAFDEWSQTPVHERAGLIRELANRIIALRGDLREAVSREMGKTWKEADEDVQSLLDSLQYYASEIARLTPEYLPDRQGTHRHELRNVPVGVVVAFLSWNFPLLNLGFKLAPALAAGCPIIIKPSPKSPVSAYIVGQLCSEVGFPPGTVNILCGPDEQIGSRLAQSRVPALLTLIGSAATARSIAVAGASSIKRYSMELGGNAPFVLFFDADLQKAADILVSLKFGNAGQICVAPNRVLVAEAVKDAFTELIVQRAKEITLGGDQDMGPVIDMAAVERLSGLVHEAVANGAQLLVGGGPPDREDLKGGSFFEPTVLGGVRPGMKVYDQEVFGPIVSLTSFADEAQALQMANDTDSGLVAYIFTDDLRRQEHFAEKLRFGEVQVNGVKYSVDLPHGGIGQSGFGHDCSLLALRDYLAIKRVTTAMDAAKPASATPTRMAGTV